MIETKRRRVWLSKVVTLAYNGQLISDDVRSANGTIVGVRYGSDRIDEAVDDLMAQMTGKHGRLLQVVQITHSAYSLGQDVFAVVTVLAEDR